MKTDEDQEKYEIKKDLEDAMEMLGSGYHIILEAPRKYIARQDGKMVEFEEPAWVKFSTGFKKELKTLDEYSLKVFLYIGLSVNWHTGTSYPGVRKIAEETGMDKDTVSGAVKKLEELGFLSVVRKIGASNVYEPMRYISIGTVPPEGTLTDEPSLENHKLSLQEQKLSLDSRVDLLNKNNKKEQESLSPEELEEVNKKVDKILELNMGQAYHWKGREFFRDNHLEYADWYHEKTSQICSKKYQRSWQKAFSDWQDNELEITHLQEAYENDVEWKKFIADPNELTKKAIAIKAVRDNEPKTPQRIPGQGFYA